MSIGSQNLPGVTPLGPPLIPPAGAQQPTVFYEPLVVATPGTTPGQVLLAYRFELDNSLGNFSGSPTTPGAILTFPPGTLLWKVLVNIAPAYNGTTPVLALGTSTGGSQIADIPLETAGAEEVPVTTPLPGPGGQVFVSQAISAGTAGHVTVAILYLGAPAAPWR